MKKGERKDTSGEDSEGKKKIKGNYNIISFKFVNIIYLYFIMKLNKIIKKI